MKYVAIPGTELRASCLCLGSNSFGTTINARDSLALLDEFVTVGGNFIDTAHIYADWIPGTKSISEKTIGQWLKARGTREQIIIGTKGGHPVLSTMGVSRLSRTEIVQDLSESLDFLGTDYIDLYWLHRDDPTIPVAEIIDILNEQVQAGKIRYFGVSNWTIARIQAALDYAAGHKLHTIVANQPLWSLAAPSMELHPDKTIVNLDQAGIDFHKQRGMAVIPYSSQAHGFFSKLASAGRAGVPKADLILFDNETNQKRLERIRDLADQKAVQINDMVLAYLLSQPFPTLPIIGPKRIDQLHSSVGAVAVSLTPAELAYLES